MVGQVLCKLRISSGSGRRSTLNRYGDIVVEPDDVYEFASTLRASGGARGLFSSRPGYARVVANQPYAERGTV